MRVNNAAIIDEFVPTQPPVVGTVHGDAEALVSHTSVYVSQISEEKRV